MKSIIVNYENLERWDSKFFLNSLNWKIKNTSLIKIKDILKKVKREKTKPSIELEIIEKINFSGEVFLRDKNNKKNLTGNLYEVKPNEFIFSKMGIKFGSLAYNKFDFPFYVSSEYPTYKLIGNKVLIEYLFFLLRHAKIQNYFQNLINGGARTRNQTSDFENLKIPIPCPENPEKSLQIQKEIINKYNERIDKIISLKKDIKHKEININEYLLNILNLEKKEKNSKKLFSIDYFDLNSWGVEKIKNKTENKFRKCPYKIVKLKDISTFGSGGTPSRSKKSYYSGNIPWIKTTEVRNNIIYDTEEKITEIALKNSSAKLYPKGSLIIAMYGQGLTRGRTAKLGIDSTTNQACGVLYNFSKDINEDYLWNYLMLEYHNLRNLASGNNQPNINGDMIKNYEIPLPPLEIQKEIVTHIENIKSDIKEMDEAIEILEKLAKTELEKNIEEGL